MGETSWKFYISATIPNLNLSVPHTSAVGLMDPHNTEKLSELTVKELWTCLAGILSIPSALKSNKSALLEYVAKYAPTEQLEFLL